MRYDYKHSYSVLILVLMEDTLGEQRRVCHNRHTLCLNPCSNGRYSRRVRGVKALFQAGGE
mgnify:CR=1 FL=1